MLNREGRTDVRSQDPAEASATDEADGNSTPEAARLSGGPPSRQAPVRGESDGLGDELPQLQDPPTGWNDGMQEAVTRELLDAVEVFARRASPHRSTRPLSGPSRRGRTGPDPKGHPAMFPGLLARYRPVRGICA